MVTRKVEEDEAFENHEPESVDSFSLLIGHRLYGNILVVAVQTPGRCNSNIYTTYKPTTVDSYLLPQDPQPHIHVGQCMSLIFSQDARSSTSEDDRILLLPARSRVEGDTIASSPSRVA